jgi:hypothetical protein
MIMFARLKRDADKFLKEKKEIENTLSAGTSPAKDKKNSPQALAEKKEQQNTKPSSQTKTDAQEKKPTVTEKLAPSSDAPNYNLTFGFTAAAAIGFGLFVAYNYYKGDSSGISADIPVKPSV